MKVVVLAAGEATRLKPLTNYIPKILMMVGKQTAMHHIIKFWESYVDDVTIVVHSKYKELVESQFKDFPDMNLSVRCVDEALGSAYCIKNSLDSSYNGQVMFQWCDVIPTQKNFQDFSVSADHPTVFTATNIKCRYQMDNNGLRQVQDNSGNVFGMYYIPQYFNDFEHAEGEDFVDCLYEFGDKLAYMSLEDYVIDFGDTEKYNALADDEDKSREFNSLKIMGDRVVKRAVNEKGKEIIRKEIDWYLDIHRKISKKEFMKPNVLPIEGFSTEKDMFSMRKVDGNSIYEVFPSMSSAAQQALLCNVMFALSDLHYLDLVTVGNEQVMNDIEKEAKGKLITRCAAIKDAIDSFGEVEYVNGYKVNSLEDCIEYLDSRIKAIHKDTITYDCIHGDTQFSNLMLDENENVLFIDPRGYFGDTIGSGLGSYDKAKVLYSLSGYDQFNYSRHFHIESLENKSIEFTIPSSGLHKDIELERFFTEEEYLWLGVVWIGLAEYIKNDPVKSVCSYYHGLYLTTKLMNGEAIEL